MNTRGTGGGGHWLRIEEKKPNPTIPEGKLDSRKPLEVESLLKELGKKREEEKWEEKIFQFLPFQSFKLT